jgi:hypothetical protein
LLSYVAVRKDQPLLSFLQVSYRFSRTRWRKDNDFTVLGSQALHFFGVNIDPTAATPPAGAALLPLSIFSHSFQVLHGVDLAKAAFLALPAPLVSQVVDPPVVKYSPSTLSDGNVSGPGSPPAGLGTIATQGTFISDGRSYRSATLFLFPLLYLPHRTRAGGDVLLYAVMRLLNSAGGRRTASTASGA